MVGMPLHTFIGSIVIYELRNLLSENVDLRSDSLPYHIMKCLHPHHSTFLARQQDQPDTAQRLTKKNAPTSKGKITDWIRTRHYRLPLPVMGGYLSITTQLLHSARTATPTLRDGAGEEARVEKNTTSHS